jgi:mono/diheme cytochrome c family protein
MGPRLQRLAPLAGLGLLLVVGWAACPGLPDRPLTAEEELGNRKLRSHCLSCHTLDGPPEKNPLAPKVKGWTKEQAYVNVGRLDKLNRNMLLNFQGTDEERRALAGALERLGAGKYR